MPDDRHAGDEPPPAPPLAPGPARDPLAFLRSSDPPLDRPPPQWRTRLDSVAELLGVPPAALARAVLVAAAAVAVVAAGVVGVVVWRGSGGGDPGAAPVPAAERDADLPFAGATTTSAAPAVVVVHAAGAVASPGVYELPAGSRVVDLVERAGGLAADADPAGVNLAEPLTDGARVYLPRVGEVPPGPPGASGSPTAGVDGEGDDGPVDLNTADEAALDRLPGIGPATAAAIVAHRQANGPFATVDELLDVRGIGPAKLEQLRPLVTVGAR